MATEGHKIRLCFSMLARPVAIDQAWAFATEMRNVEAFGKSLLGQITSQLPPPSGVVPARTALTTMPTLTSMVIETLGTFLGLEKEEKDFLDEIFAESLTKGRICLETDFDKRKDFLIKNGLPTNINGCYEYFKNEMHATAATDAGLVSVISHELGHAFAHNFLDCGDKDEVFSMFFQLTSFYICIQDKLISKGEAMSLLDNFMTTMLIEVGVFNRCEEMSTATVPEAKSVEEGKATEGRTKEGSGKETEAVDVLNIFGFGNIPTENQACCKRLITESLENNVHYGFSTILALRVLHKFVESGSHNILDAATEIRNVSADARMWQEYFSESNIKESVTWLYELVTKME
ncbi:hypothetical protein AGMMS49949_02400 [Alphaproteobacteria bacterium]|nr:hypothetical protein AGMMS49949_02400 [Alphaproteobacteria bacterium]GHS96971.1 hypothetical protein AGMMS50296_3550 [Alphaproteobacteria bacterium]